MTAVDFFFDFISPYSYLAHALLCRDKEYADICVRYRPVSFGLMVGKLGIRAPGEIPSRRQRILEDILLLCQHYDIPFRGPPKHPFNSIYALRAVASVEDPQKQRTLVQNYFTAAWAETQNLEDMQVLRSGLAHIDESRDPEEIATTAIFRQKLKHNTEMLLSCGGWGVPSFVVDDLVFFGHDRLPLLRLYLNNRIQLDHKRITELLTRPGLVSGSSS